MVFGICAAGIGYLFDLSELVPSTKYAAKGRLFPSPRIPIQTLKLTDHSQIKAKLQRWPRF